VRIGTFESWLGENQGKDIGVPGKMYNSNSKQRKFKVRGAEPKFLVLLNWLHDFDACAL